MPGQTTSLTGTVAALVADQYYSLALKADGTVWGWGHNGYGQLGDGTTTERLTPVQVTGLPSRATAIATGGFHSVALLNDGTVWTWGYNGWGELGDGTTTNRSAPVQVTGLTGTFTAVAAGGDDTSALRSDGTVWVWGADTSGEAGTGTTSFSSPPAQATALAGVTAIAEGSGYMIALKSDGSVWAWGDNSSGKLGDGTTTDRTTPVQVVGLTDVTAIAAGGDHTLALQNGNVWAWGRNDSGQLGDGTTTNRSTPTKVIGLTDTVATVVAAYSHTMVLQADGTVWAWGGNYYSQLGTTSTDSCSGDPCSTTPLQVIGQ